MAIALRNQFSQSSFDGGGSAVATKSSPAQPTVGSIGLTTKTTNNPVAIGSSAKAASSSLLYDALVKANALTEVEDGFDVAKREVEAIKSYSPTQLYTQKRALKTNVNPYYNPTPNASSSRNLSTTAGTKSGTVTKSEIQPTKLGAGDDRNGNVNKQSTKLQSYISDQVNKTPSEVINNIINGVIDDVSDGKSIDQAIRDSVETIVYPSYQVSKPSSTVKPSLNPSNTENKLQSTLGSQESKGNTYNLYGGGQRRKRKRRYMK